jgi:lactoylglutathione lyase
MSDDKARALGINHVALEVADIDAALDFCGQLFEFELRGRGERSAFIDLGDQFIALFTGDNDAVDQGRHFGLVVDDPDSSPRSASTSWTAPASTSAIPGAITGKW